MKLIQHFPWQRLTMMLITIAMMGLVMYKYVDWLYYFATIPSAPTGATEVCVGTSTPAVQQTSITALSAAAATMLVCLSMILTWFITGSNKTIEAMYKFNEATVTQTALSSASQIVESTQTIHQDFQTPELHERYDDR